MASAKQYLVQLKQVLQAVAFKMGHDLTETQKSDRVLVNSLGLTVAVLMKLLVDKGIVTNAELSAAFDFVRDDGYDDEPSLP